MTTSASTLRKPLLVLTTPGYTPPAPAEPVDRTFLTIDGTPYELRGPSEFGIAQYLTLTRESHEFDRLMVSTRADEAMIERVRELLRSMCRRVLVDVPDAVLDLLSDEDRAQIMVAFTRQPQVANAMRAIADAGAVKPVREATHA